MLLVHITDLDVRVGGNFDGFVVAAQIRHIDRKAVGTNREQGGRRCVAVDAGQEREAGPDCITAEAIAPSLSGSIGFGLGLVTGLILIAAAGERKFKCNPEFSSAVTWTK